MQHLGERLKRFGGLFAVHDLILLAYYFIVSVLLVVVGPDRADPNVTRRVYFCIALLMLGCLIGRGPNGLGPRARSLVYRGSVVYVILDGYLMLAQLLPVIRADTVDDALLALDLKLFGFEPAFEMERWTTPAVVEYFAFFYFSYFAICFLYMVAAIGRPPWGRETSAFAIGTVIVCCLGQLGYMAVPAYGPIKYMADDFQGPLVGGFWWDAVTRTVAAGSAQKDVFPSLHTAMPLWFALHAATRARRSRTWRVAAIVTGIFSAHIIVSTMLLRWHYLIDVIAGIGLAAFARWASVKLSAWEEKTRAGLDAEPVWSFGDPALNSAPTSPSALP